MSSLRPLRILPSTWPLAIAAGVMAALALALAWLGLRTVGHDRVQAEQRIRQDARDAAERGARELDAALGGWRDAVARVPPAKQPPDPFPQPLRDALAAPGAAALLIVDPGGAVRVQARQSLLYLPGDAAAVSPFATLPAPLVAAENIEVRERDLPRAIAAYRRLLAAAAPAGVHNQVRLFLARTLLKAGRPEEALAEYDRLSRDATDSPLGAMAADERCTLIEALRPPADLHACAAAFRQDLVASRWPLEKSLYEFYAASARTWLEPDGRASGPPAAGSADTEQRKRHLGELAGEAVREWRGRQPKGDAGEFVLGDPPDAIVFWSGRAGGSGALAVVSAAYLVSRAWPGIRAAAGEAFDLALVAGDGPAAAAAVPARRSPADAAAVAPPPAAEGLDASAPSLVDGRRVWQVRAWPRDAADRRAALRRRQAIYFAMLGVMLVSLVLGGAMAIRSARKDVEVARLKSEFVSAVSHEFRTPLTAIRHLSEMLDTGRVQDEERRKEYYGLIFGESRRLARLVENLLDFARIEEGRQEFRMERVEAAPLVTRAVEEFQASGAASGKPIELGVAPDLQPPAPDAHGRSGQGTAAGAGASPFIRADAQALATVVHNLLDNAVKYSPDGRPVRVEVAADGPRLVISVADEGAGIAAEDLPHVFDRFYRGRDGGAHPGTGLGLALVRRIVLAHGGTVHAASQPGQGSTFTVRLPLAGEGRG